MLTPSTSPELNPNIRQTGWKTYFQAIWDTINLSDFGREIWLSTKFFFNFLMGKRGVKGEETKLQKTFMPSTLEDGSELPMVQRGYDKEGSSWSTKPYNPSEQDAYNDNTRLISLTQPQAQSQTAWAQHASQNQLRHEMQEQDQATFPTAQPTGPLTSSATTLERGPSVSSQGTTTTAYFTDDAGSSESHGTARWPEARPMQPTNPPLSQYPASSTPSAQPPLGQRPNLGYAEYRQ